MDSWSMNRVVFVLLIGLASSFSTVSAQGNEFLEEADVKITCDSSIRLLNRLKELPSKKEALSEEMLKDFVCLLHEYEEFIDTIPLIGALNIDVSRCLVNTHEALVLCWRDLEGCFSADGQAEVVERLFRLQFGLFVGLKNIRVNDRNQVIKDFFKMNIPLFTSKSTIEPCTIDDCVFYYQEMISWVCGLGVRLRSSIVRDLLASQAFLLDRLVLILGEYESLASDCTQPAQYDFQISGWERVVDQILCIQEKNKILLRRCTIEQLMEEVNYYNTSEEFYERGGIVTLWVKIQMLIAILWTEDARINHDIKQCWQDVIDLFRSKISSKVSSEKRDSSWAERHARVERQIKEMEVMGKGYYGDLWRQGA
jgi:hypothetical protein